MLYIYSLFGCPFSEAAEDLVIQTRVPHKIIKITTQKEKDKYKKLHEMETFPQIFFKNSRGKLVKIGGYEEFRSIVEMCRHVKK
jgi:glutaredoxin